jgi:peroxiredoxin
MPSMEALHRELNENGLVLLAVNYRETAEEVRAFSREHQLSFPAVLDENGDLFERFNVWFLPTTFIIDKKGEVVGKVIGYRDWHDEQTLAGLRRLLDDRS